MEGPARTMWKPNWSETQQRFIRWWNREGLLVGMWGALDVGRAVHASVPVPVPPEDLTQRYTDPHYRAAANRYRLSRSVFPLDILPSADTDLGPGSLALLLGSEPAFAEDTVWFHPCIEHVQEPESLAPFAFDANHPWWLKTKCLLESCVEDCDGQYLVPCPDLVENMDILASVRGAEAMCLDLIDRPEWVEQKINEINQVWFDAYQRIYDIIKRDDGSSAFGPFYIWGPGKVAKLQCDTSVLFSPEMYRRFVLPSLTEQCAWLDHSLYHLDGTQAIMHLDTVLEIEALDAIEWTPQAGIESGGHPRWYDLYRRILAAGKSIQVVNVELNEIVPLLDAIGKDGVYIMISFRTERDVEQATKLVEPYCA